MEIYQQQSDNGQRHLLAILMYGNVAADRLRRYGC